MSRLSVREEYFEWMYDLVCSGRYEGPNSYRKLLMTLHDTDYDYVISSDVDRAYDGVGLRHRYALLRDDYDYDYIKECLHGPCSVLEMMIALAIRCEETIMSNAKVGDRTGQWFWKMVSTLGLGGMTDNHFDEISVYATLAAFLSNDYEPDGRGGLFRVRNSGYDFRRVSIWKQMCCFLNTMI